MSVGKLIKYVLVWSVVFTSLAYSKTWCVPPPIAIACDQDSDSCHDALTYAMDKQKKDLKERLEDLVDTIKENTEQTKHQTKIIEQEVLAYRRLLARIKKETVALSEAKYLSKKLNQSEILGTKINMLQKENNEKVQ